jgi:hypothetical protein
MNIFSGWVGGLSHPNRKRNRNDSDFAKKKRSPRYGLPKTIQSDSGSTFIS